MMAIPAWVWPVLICALAGAIHLLASGRQKHLPRLGLGGLIGRGRGPVKMLSRTALGPGNAIVVVQLWDTETAFLLSRQGDSCSLIATRSTDESPVAKNSCRTDVSSVQAGDDPGGLPLPGNIQSLSGARRASGAERSIPDRHLRGSDTLAKVRRTPSQARPAGGVPPSRLRATPVRRLVTIRRSQPQRPLLSFAPARRQGGAA